MAPETVQDSQTTALHNGGAHRRRAQPGHRRDESPPLIYLPRTDAPPDQIPVHPPVLAFLSLIFRTLSVEGKLPPQEHSLAPAQS